MIEPLSMATQPGRNTSQNRKAATARVVNTLEYLW